MPVPESSNGWSEWSKHVLLELERHDKLLGSIDMKVNRIQTDIALLKFKSGLWGGLAGVATGIGGSIVIMLLKHAVKP